MEKFLDVRKSGKMRPGLMDKNLAVDDIKDDIKQAKERVTYNIKDAPAKPIDLTDIKRRTGFKLWPGNECPKSGQLVRYKGFMSFQGLNVRVYQDGDTSVAEFIDPKDFEMGRK